MKKVMIMGIVIVGIISNAVLASDLKIGVVDYQKVYTQAPQGQATVQSLQSKLQPKIKQMKTQQQELMKQMQKLEKEKPTLTQNEYTTQQADLQRKGQSFQMKVQQMRQQQMQKEKQLAGQFKSVLTSAIKKIGKKDDYDLILSSQAAPYAHNKFDVTEQVLKIMKQ